MKYAIPASRHLVLPSIGTTIIILIIYVFSPSWIRDSNLDSTILSQAQRGVPLTFPASKISDDTIITRLFTTTFSSPKQNAHIEVLLKCPRTPNRITNTIRLPHPILNISLINPDDPKSASQNQYFNPTLIPLPPHSPHPYLLLSRLVTKGLHQESHICLAESCQPQNQTHLIKDEHPQSLSADSHTCTPSDMQYLGPHGGIHCVTSPQRLNIPPTPARQCEGAWSAFPDIPGFHDPRVFWSGKGEPLVVVNSGSGYGCVGLWVVDLRSVYSEMKELMGRKGRYAGAATVKEEKESKRSEQGDEIALLPLALPWVPAKMSYPFLTEITRNPRESRGSVEKNWVMFFPKGEQAWVQYDLVGHGSIIQQSALEVSHVNGNTTLDMDDQVNNAPSGTWKQEERYKNAAGSVASTENDSVLFNLSDTIFDKHKLHVSTYNTTARSGHDLHNRSTHLPRKINSQTEPQPRPHLTPSRSLSKMLGSGYTTTNLTSPDESPCLTSDHVRDNLNKKGHWHQGSNSLRLVLCSRMDTSCLSNHDEDTLVTEGKVVHFAVLHRKFSNDIDLPMRYERYIMVWEARLPFRMVGISKYPMLFAGERAQPWSMVENELSRDDVEAARWKDVYFMYTPSLAWSWRKESVMDNARDGTASGLGTGYLGDDVIVGIGMDDVAQGFVKVKVEELLSCLRLCPNFEVMQRG